MISLGDISFGTRNSPTTQRRKNMLMRLCRVQKKRCFYCNKKVRFKQLKEDGGQLENNATIEHIYHKRDIRRAISNPMVLCCYGCNQKRNDEYESFYQSIDDSQPIIDIRKFIKYSKLKQQSV